MDIAGFIIVYRQGCTRPWVPGNIVVPLGRLGSIFYGGVQREPWDAIAEHYQARTLPARFLEARERMRAPRTYLGLEVCQDVQTASELLAFGRITRPDSELIAVRSPQLFETKGRIAVDDALVEWAGIDIVVPGSASLLEEGLLRKPELFPGWAASLRPTGVLADGVSVDAYVAAYRAGVEQGKLEDLLQPLPGGHHIDPIQVGAVNENRLP